MRKMTSCLRESCEPVSSFFPVLVLRMLRVVKAVVYLCRPQIRSVHTPHSSRQPELGPALRAGGQKPFTPLEISCVELYHSCSCCLTPANRFHASQPANSATQLPSVCLHGAVGQALGTMTWSCHWSMWTPGSSRASTLPGADVARNSRYNFKTSLSCEQRNTAVGYQWSYWCETNCLFWLDHLSHVSCEKKRACAIPVAYKSHLSASSRPSPACSECRPPAPPLRIRCGGLLGGLLILGSVAASLQSATRGPRPPSFREVCPGCLSMSAPLNTGQLFCCLAESRPSGRNGRERHPTGSGRRDGWKGAAASRKHLEHIGLTPLFLERETAS